MQHTSSQEEVSLSANATAAAPVGATFPATGEGHADAAPPRAPDGEPQCAPVGWAVRDVLDGVDALFLGWNVDRAGEAGELPIPTLVSRALEDGRGDVASGLLGHVQFSLHVLSEAMHYSDLGARRPEDVSAHLFTLEQMTEVALELHRRGLVARKETA